MAMLLHEPCRRRAILEHDMGNRDLVRRGRSPQVGVDREIRGNRRMALSRWSWAAFNALQLVFTLLWTAGWITLALLVLLVTRRRHLPLRMAARCWAPGCCAARARDWSCAASIASTGAGRTCWSRITSR